MIGNKHYSLIILANHKPSKWALETIHEYFGGKSYVHVDIYKVTNNYSLKSWKRKFKFDDLPCLHIKECVAKGKYKKECYYGDDIEIQCKEGARKEIRNESRRVQRERAASLRLRVRQAQQTREHGIVLPAPGENATSRRNMPDVCGGKKEGNR